MGDISREPLADGRRARAGGRNSPAEVIRLEEISMDDSVAPPEAQTDTDEAAGAVTPRSVADEVSARGGADGSDADPTTGSRSFAALRPAPAVPLRIDPLRPAPRGDADSGHGPPPARFAAADEEPVVVDWAASPVEVERHLPLDESPSEARGATPEVDQLVDDAPDGEARAEPLHAAEDAGVPAVELPEVDAGDDLPELTEPHELSRVLMAVLLSSREPLKLLRLAEICNSTQKAVQAGLERLQSDLHAAGMPLEVVRAGETAKLATAPAVYGYLARMRKVKRAEKLSPAALETLAVVAYRQPAIRAEIEAIRGVKVGPMLRSLLEHKLVKVVGRADVPGRPLQYGTTQLFLERFGLGSLKDLPSVQEFRSLG